MKDIPARGYSYLTNDPAACIHCHAGVYLPYKKAGGGDLIKGFEQVNHMPYTRVGALKISDHHVRSPLLNINNACRTCHKWPEEELRARVETIQDRTFKMRNIAMDALIQLINDIKAAKDSGKSDEELQQARDFQRRAQFYLDFVEAENSTGFHADQEAVRILGESVNFSRLGQLSLRGGIPPQPASPVPTSVSAAATPSH